MYGGLSLCVCIYIYSDNIDLVDKTLLEAALHEHRQYLKQHHHRHHHNNNLNNPNNPNHYKNKHSTIMENSPNNSAKLPERSEQGGQQQTQTSSSSMSLTL